MCDWGACKFARGPLRDAQCAVRVGSCPEKPRNAPPLPAKLLLATRSAACMPLIGLNGARRPCRELRLTRAPAPCCAGLERNACIRVHVRSDSTAHPPFLAAHVPKCMPVIGLNGLERNACIRVHVRSDSPAHPPFLATHVPKCMPLIGRTALDCPVATCASLVIAPGHQAWRRRWRRLMLAPATWYAALEHNACSRVHVRFDSPAHPPKHARSKGERTRACPVTTPPFFHATQRRTASRARAARSGCHATHATPTTPSHQTLRGICDRCVTQAAAGTRTIARRSRGQGPGPSSGCGERTGAGASNTQTHDHAFCKSTATKS